MIYCLILWIFLFISSTFGIIISLSPPLNLVFSSHNDAGVGEKMQYVGPDSANQGPALLITDQSAPGRQCSNAKIAILIAWIMQIVILAGQELPRIAAPWNSDTTDPWCDIYFARIALSRWINWEILH